MGRPRIGLSACFLHDPDRQRNLFRGKTLVYMERSMMDWLLGAGALPCLLPPTAGEIPAEELLEGMDGLLLQAGDDVCPRSYGQEPLRPEWIGDAARDAEERALLDAALARDLPVLAVCRGLQLLNVARGGTLLQDIPSQRPEARQHRDGEVYDRLGHRVELAPGSRLAELYGRASGWVNSIHHQAVDRLGEGLVIEARCPEDGMVEALRLPGARYCMAVQWHPEMMTRPVPDALPASTLLDDFLDACGR